MLQFLFTEINYGGRVTDDKDRRLMSNLVTTFCGPQVLEEGYAFSPSATYTTPSCETVAQVRRSCPVQVLFCAALHATQLDGNATKLTGCRWLRSRPHAAITCS